MTYVSVECPTNQQSNMDRGYPRSVLLHFYQERMMIVFTSLRDITTLAVLILIISDVSSGIWIGYDMFRECMVRDILLQDFIKRELSFRSIFTLDSKIQYPICFIIFLVFVIPQLIVALTVYGGCYLKHLVK